MNNRLSLFGLTRSGLILLSVVLIAGIFFRVWPSTGFHDIGHDERVYSTYVSFFQKAGIWHYGKVVREYSQWQGSQTNAFVPATRIGFLWPASMVATIARVEPVAALHCISLVFSILLLLVTPIISYRLRAGPEHLQMLTALMAVAPLQIHLAQRSLVDGYFAFWTILCAWFLWESLQNPGKRIWLVAYGASLFVLVLTKENAAFVFIALVGVLIVSTLLKFNRANSALVLVTMLAPALAVTVLAVFVGGIDKWIAFYRMYVTKSELLAYPVRFQDGAWYRYLVDFMLLSPCIMILAIGRVFQLDAKSRPEIFWSIFLAFSFVAMSSVRYGMSLRFAAYWDLPLRWLAASQVLCLARRFPRINPVFIAAVVVFILMVLDLFQYWRYFMNGAIYDPVTSELLHASKLFK